MASTFPLFKLPYVAIRHFLTVLNLKNIIFLSMCSRKTKALLKSHRALFPEFWIEVNYFISGAVEVFATGDLFTFKTFVSSPLDSYLPKTSVKIGNTNVVAFLLEGSLMYTYWHDEVFGIRILLDYLTDLFNLPVSGLCLDQKNVNVRDRIFGMIPSPTQDLIIEYRSSEESVFDISCLMAANTKFISLLNPKLTVGELNGFLKNWVLGGNSNMKSLNIRMKMKNRLGILLELDGIQREKDVQRVYTNGYGNYLRIRGGYDIVRESDQKTATIILNPNAFLMVVWD